LIDNGFKLYSDVDLVPVRGLLKDHAVANNISVHRLCKSVNIDKWNTLNTQDLKKETCEKIISKYPNRSPLTVLLSSQILWKRVVKIERIDNISFQDVEVEGTHNYVGSGVVSHNCNLPARRVIILGVHRGLSLVESYDMIQMSGRAGRVGLDPRGDVHILLPKKHFEAFRDNIKKPENINSRLLDFVGNDTKRHYKTLAFHLVSEIHHGNVQTRKDIHAWYEKSLAHFQTNKLEKEIVDSTLDSLLKCGAVKEEGKGIFAVTAVGRVASMFYFSPFDVADLKRNFDKVFENELQESDLAISMAFGNIDTIRMGIVSRAERDAMGMYQAKVQRYMPGMMDTAIKGGYCYFCLMNGHDPGALAAFARNLAWDFPRLTAVLYALDSMAGKWGESQAIKRWSLRVTYGVRNELVELCMIPNIGKARAEKLWAAGLHGPEDVADNAGNKVGRALNMKPDKIAEIVKEARKITLLQ
jgi:helicase